MHSATSSRVLSVRGILELLFRHKWKVLLVPLLSVLLGAGILLYFPRTYQSEAILFLQIGRETVGIDPSATQGHTIGLQQSGRDDEVKSAIDILTSRGVLQQAVQRVGVDLILGRVALEGAAEPNPVAEVVGKVVGTVIGSIQSIDPISDEERALIVVSESLSVDSERGSTALEVSMEADSPRLAQTILTAVIESFREEHSRIHRNQGSQAFFAEQYASLTTQLNDAKQAVLEAKNQRAINSVTRRGETLEGQLLAIDLEKHKTEQELATSTARAAALRSEMESLPERVATSKTTMPNEGVDLLRSELYALEIRQADLKARYSDSHPLVVAITSQVDEAKKVVDAQAADRFQTVDDMNPVYQQLELMFKEQENLVAGYQARLESLNEQRQLVLEDMKELNEHENLVNRLEREVVLCEQKVFKYAESYEQARIDQELELQAISNISISQPPMLLEKPASPSKLLVLLASFMMATLGTTALVVASERLSDRVRTEDQLRALVPLPVLATIPDDTRLRRVLTA